MTDEKRPPDLPMYVPMSEGTPIETTELDWQQTARDDWWELVDGAWEHPDDSVVYEDGDWVYVGGGQWEDAEVMTWTPEQRREMNARYLKLLQDTVTALTDEPGRHGDEQGTERNS